MKIKPSVRAGIHANILPQLIENATEKRTVYDRVSGAILIANGKTHNGKEIIRPGDTYRVPRETAWPVSHERRINSIIDSASTYDAMTDALSAYLRKWGTKFQNPPAATESK